MRLALVFLVGLCALMAQAQVSPDFSDWPNLDIDYLEEESNKPGFVTDYLNKLVEKIKAYVQKNVDALEAELKVLVDKFVSELLYLVDFSLMNVHRLIRDAKAKLVMSKDNNAIECYDKFRPILDDIYSKAKYEVENCVVYAIGEIYRVRKNVQDNIDIIKSEIGAIQGILKKCIRPINPFYTMKCMLQNTSAIMKSLKDIISNAFEVLKISAAELSQISSNAKSCIKKTVKDAEGQVKAILKDIQYCMENGISTEAPSTEKPTTTTITPEITSTDPPATVTTTTESPVTEAPSTEPPTLPTTTTESPVTELPPATETNTTESPVTELPPAIETTITESPVTESASREPSTSPTTLPPDTQEMLRLPTSQ